MRKIDAPARVLLDERTAELKKDIETLGDRSFVDIDTSMAILKLEDLLRLSLKTIYKEKRKYMV